MQNTYKLIVFNQEKGQLFGNCTRSKPENCSWTLPTMCSWFPGFRLVHFCNKEFMRCVTKIILYNSHLKWCSEKYMQRLFEGYDILIRNNDKVSNIRTSLSTEIGGFSSE